jgi:hypothetical protein
MSYLHFIRRVLKVSIDDKNNSWVTPNLRDRAYFAAWFFNVNAMFYMNITNPKNRAHPTRFEYLNSTVGAKFPIPNDAQSFQKFKTRYDELRLQGEYGNFLVSITSFLFHLVRPERTIRQGTTDSTRYSRVNRV